MMMALETITMQKLVLELKGVQDSQSRRHAGFAGSEDILFQEQLNAFKSKSYVAKVMLNTPNVMFKVLLPHNFDHILMSA